MLAEERFHRIVQLVEERKTVTVQELTKLLESSESTIRRDLAQLHAKGRLIKVHGGAAAISQPLRYRAQDDLVSVRQDRNRNEKLLIAKYAASCIQNDDFIYLDAGTTTDLMIDFIEAKNITFVTNAVSHAKRLVQRGYRTYLPGGSLKLSTDALVGGEAMRALQKYNFTKGFFGTNGISRSGGFSTPDVMEGTVKEQAVNRCREVYILADPSKFNQLSSVTFASFDDARIITTSPVDDAYRDCSNLILAEEDKID